MTETAETRDVRARRLAELKRRVASGRYDVPAERVADAILDAHRRGAQRSIGGRSCEL